MDKKNIVEEVLLNHEQPSVGLDAVLAVVDIQQSVEDRLKSTDKAVRLAAIEEVLRSGMLAAKAAGVKISGNLWVEKSQSGQVYACAIGASMVAETGSTETDPDGDRGRAFATKRLGMNQDERNSFIRGFDGGNREFATEKPFYDMGRRLRVEFAK